MAENKTVKNRILGLKTNLTWFSALFKCNKKVGIFWVSLFGDTNQKLSPFLDPQWSSKSYSFIAGLSFLLCMFQNICYHNSSSFICSSFILWSLRTLISWRLIQTLGWTAELLDNPPLRFRPSSLLWLNISLWK